MTRYTLYIDIDIVDVTRYILYIYRYSRCDEVYIIFIVAGLLTTSKA